VAAVLAGGSAGVGLLVGAVVGGVLGYLVLPKSLSLPFGLRVGVP
jgi:hypothetical protein